MVRVTVDVGVEPHVRVPPTLIVEGRKDLEEQVLGDVWPCLMGVACTGIVRRQALQIPDAAAARMLDHPVGQISYRHRP
jgi:hypothetical protein